MWLCHSVTWPFITLLLHYYFGWRCKAEKVRYLDLISKNGQRSCYYSAARISHKCRCPNCCRPWHIRPWYRASLLKFWKLSITCLIFKLIFSNFQKVDKGTVGYPISWDKQPWDIQALLYMWMCFKCWWFINTLLGLYRLQYGATTRATN